MGTRRDFLKIAGASVVASSTIPLESEAAAETAPKAIVPPFQSPELVSLYETYTAGPASIGANLTKMTVKAGADDPLIVATGTDMAIFPGGGRPPMIQSFRLSTRGFKELAGISHFGPALASIVNMHALEPTNDLWRKDAERLAAATKVARAANSPRLWRDQIAVEAYRGREDAIAAMVDYACAITLRYLEAVLMDETKLTPDFLRQEYLEAKRNALGATVPFNVVMIATFFLVALDISHRVMTWFKEQSIDWNRAMVLVAGQQGRPTAGVTWTTNSVCQLILGASNQKLSLERMYIAPHAKSFTVKDPSDLDAVRAVEQPLRSLWFYTRAISNLAPTMFEGYPRYAPGSYVPPVIGKDTKELSEMPRIFGPDDMLTMTTRLRLVIEDPRQLLSGCVTDYAVEQLRLNGNNPFTVVVPGLDRYAYPTGL
ncbi:hypothetical protein V1281_007895 [Nitrobacteraceae bacterium AZCC 2161]